MKLSCLLETIAIAVANDADLEVYCQTKFGKSVSVHVHIDPKNAPGIAAAPWVGLTVQSYRRPTENNCNIVSFDLESATFCFEPNFAPSPVTVNGSVTILKGFEVLEEMSDLVFAAIEKAVSTSADQLEMTYNDEQSTSLTIADFPGWVSSRAWTVSKHV